MNFCSIAGKVAFMHQGYNWIFVEDEAQARGQVSLVFPMYKL